MLERPCPECGFDAAAVRPRRGPEPRLRATRSAWQAVLADADVAVRPAADVWSPLEYACHVRDVHRVFDERLAADARRGRPAVRELGPGRRPRSSGGYGEQDPATVAAELVEARRGGRASATPRVDGRRSGTARGRRSNGSVFTVDTLGALPPARRGAPPARRVLSR